MWYLKEYKASKYVFVMLTRRSTLRLSQVINVPNRAFSPYPLLTKNVAVSITCISELRSLRPLRTFPPFGGYKWNIMGNSTGGTGETSGLQKCVWGDYPRSSLEEYDAHPGFGRQRPEHAVYCVKRSMGISPFTTAAGRVTVKLVHNETFAANLDK